MKIRCGAIRYLNALPLLDGLEREPDFEVRYGVPSLLARDLRKGDLDVALVPQVEAPRDPHYRIVPGLGISCQGAVDSILLFATREWRQIEKVGVDLSSDTSVELLRVLFHLRGVEIPELVRVPPRLDPLRDPDHGLDAVLLIGDRALAEDHGEFPRFDLGALWKEATGLPFVFAVWLGRQDLPSTAIETLQQAGRRGIARRDALADEFCREHPEVIDARGARRYLRESISYGLGEAEVESMREFHRMRAEAGSPVAEGWQPRFYEEPR